MHSFRLYLSFLVLPVALVGCSTTAGTRFGGTPQSKSIAVVGERPLPAASGEPGGQVIADVSEPEPRRNPKTRISGRVVDEQGEPVPNVVVRLADGGTKGGKDIRGLTDKSGAFTINGLRPGSTYSLIAEGEDERGMLTGRATAMTAETGLVISLASEDAVPKPSTGRSPRSSRARPISSRESLPDGSGEDETSRINREDLANPAADPSTLDPGPPSTSQIRRPQLSPPQPSMGWRNTSASRVARTTEKDDPDTATPLPSGSARPRAVPDEEPDADEEDSNPLPPAIESNPDDSPPPSARSNSNRKVGARLPTRKSQGAGELAVAEEAGVAERPVKVKPVAKEAPESTVAADFQPLSSLVPDFDPAHLPESASVADNAKSPGEPLATVQGSALVAPLPMPPIGETSSVAQASPPATAAPPDLQATAHEVASTLPASPPVFASPPSPPPTAVATTAPPSEYNPFALAATAAPAADLALKDTRPSTKPIASAASSPDEEPDSSTTPAPVPRKKWGEVASNSQPAPVAPPARATLTSAIVKRFRPTPEKVDPAFSSCSYDSRLQRLNDFRLPDLAGNGVHFRDLDADYILLDFWGTWCAPCLDSIPHLIELQKKYGPSKLKVVGIAREQGAIEGRKAKVEEVSKRLGINYAVLLSGMDGRPCPVFESLQIQALPTMILVDRQGKILWRDTGSTAASQDRLDRNLASLIGRGETARR